MTQVIINTEVDICTAVAWTEQSSSKCYNFLSKLKQILDQLTIGMWWNQIIVCTLKKISEHRRFVKGNLRLPFRYYKSWNDMIWKTYPTRFSCSALKLKQKRIEHTTEWGDTETSLYPKPHLHGCYIWSRYRLGYKYFISHWHISFIRKHCQ